MNKHISIIFNIIVGYFFSIDLQMEIFYFKIIYFLLFQKITNQFMQIIFPKIYDFVGIGAIKMVMIYMLTDYESIPRLIVSYRNMPKRLWQNR